VPGKDGAGIVAIGGQVFTLKIKVNFPTLTNQGWDTLGALSKHEVTARFEVEILRASSSDALRMTILTFSAAC
jgi:hypothetical protein